MDELYFAKGSVPVRIAAKVFGKSPSWVRISMVNGNLPIGFVTGNGKRKNYYISPKRLYEVTGYVWKGKGNKE